MKLCKKVKHFSLCIIIDGWIFQLIFFFLLNLKKIVHPCMHVCPVWLFSLFGFEIDPETLIDRSSVTWIGMNWVTKKNRAKKLSSIDFLKIHFGQWINRKFVFHAHTFPIHIHCIYPIFCIFPTKIKIKSNNHTFSLCHKNRCINWHRNIQFVRLIWFFFGSFFWMADFCNTLVLVAQIFLEKLHSKATKQQWII